MVINTISEYDLRDKIKRMCLADNQSNVAKGFDLTPQYLSDVLCGRRNISAQFARKLGYQLEVEKTTVRVYRPIL